MCGNVVLVSVILYYYRVVWCCMVLCGVLWCCVMCVGGSGVCNTSLLQGCGWCCRGSMRRGSVLPDSRCTVDLGTRCVFS